MRTIYFSVLITFSTAFFYACDSSNKDRQQARQPEGAIELDDNISLEDSLSGLSIARGNEIATLAQQALAKKLKDAISEGGVEYAVEFCNINAYPILDSVQQTTGGVIGRVSFKTRNPEDAPDSLETVILEDYATVHARGEVPEPRATVLEDGDRILYTKPIVIDNALCLVCHGKPGKELTLQNHNTIQRLYPDDEATGYSQGDLRGMWSIRLPRKSL